MRKVIFKDRQSGATQNALDWALDGHLKWLYVVPTANARDIVVCNLLKRGINSRLKKRVVTEQQLPSIRGQLLDRIVIDELGYFKAPLKAFHELLVYHKPYWGRGTSSERSDMMIIIDKDSSKVFVTSILEELLDSDVIFEG